MNARTSVIISVQDIVPQMNRQMMKEVAKNILEDQDQEVEVGVVATKAEDN